MLSYLFWLAGFVANILLKPHILAAEAGNPLTSKYNSTSLSFNASTSEPTGHLVDAHSRGLVFILVKQHEYLTLEIIRYDLQCEDGQNFISFATCRNTSENTVGVLLHSSMRVLVEQACTFESSEVLQRFWHFLRTSTRRQKSDLFMNNNE